MIDPERVNLSVKDEKAILIRVIFTSEKDNDNPFIELEKLATTAGATVVGTILQKRGKVDPAYYLGKGKTFELASLCSAKESDVIICDDDLNPSQVKNLEKITNIKVIDRSELILDIFATHARTRQAKLQVDLAQKEYMLPRLKHLWTHLERIEGGIGMRGPGEKQLEIDRRIASKKIVDLKKKLSKIKKIKLQQLESRKNFIKISLVGYTNSGKSTLMNALTGANVLVEDKLFATLDTKTKDLKLGKGKDILLSDTVGFIKKLPHHLVSSFNATLEEAKQADLLLHVIDSSSPQAEGQIKSVNKVLRDLECDKKPTIMIFNKMDAVIDLSPIVIFKKIYKNSITISAKSGQGLDDLKKLISSHIDKDCKEVQLICNNSCGKLTSYVHENINIINKSYKDNKIYFDLSVTQDQLNKLNKVRKEFQLHDLDSEIVELTAS